MKKEQVKDLYEQHMIVDFPQSELKTLDQIMSYLDLGIYTIYGLYEKEELLAYAMFMLQEKKEFQLLDYYACNRKYRGRGYGSYLLQELSKVDQTSKGYLIEVESVRTAANEEERMIRERRIHFYEKNGLRRTSLRTNVYGVEFDILYLPIQWDGEDTVLQAAIEELYLQMFGEVNYEKYTTIEKIATNYAAQTE
ncbi:GNAT family N-acetyltransferase [Anaerosporobacter faecicola]|uniref:GNAT family N-acetyltransferase n=1 Tax=Anaerosporobacter faecicola TaxID=2718714 RepID=UPI0014397CD6|nr:GNAT family N-acetyltransferase [Anaerosporobacter faecicola]